jgi:F-type H+-transporting ATPase subunit b
MYRLAARSSVCGIALWAMLALPAVAAQEKKGGMPQLDPTAFAPQIVWLAITFILLYLLMSRVGLPRVAAVLEKRRKRISDDLSAAERLKQDAETAMATYQAALAKARTEAQAIGAKLREQNNAETTSRRAALDAELGQKGRAAEAAVVAAKQAALANLRSVAVEASRNAVDRLLGTSVSPAAAEAAVAAAIKERG